MIFNLLSFDLEVKFFLLHFIHIGFLLSFWFILIGVMEYLTIQHSMLHFYIMLPTVCNVYNVLAGTFQEFLVDGFDVKGHASKIMQGLAVGEQIIKLTEGISLLDNEIRLQVRVGTLFYLVLIFYFIMVMSF